MRHSFRFPLHIRNAVKSHVSRVIASIDARRFQQESPFTSALVAKLEGVVYENDDGFVRFTATVANDRGPGSAERWSGVDFAITATIADSEFKIQKAILIQAKLDSIDDMKPSEKKLLIGQVQKMQSLTRAPKVMECPLINGRRQPILISGNRLVANKPYRRMSLENYFVARVLTTFDGDTRTEFVSKVQDSGLSGLKINASLTKNNREPH